MGRHRIARRKRTLVAAGLLAAAIAVVTGVVLWLTPYQPVIEQNRADKLMSDLAHDGVDTGTREQTLVLADQLCEFRSQGIPTWDYLKVAYPNEDASLISWAVFNGGYCIKQR